MAVAHQMGEAGEVDMHAGHQLAVGGDHVEDASALAGAVLLLCSDIAARLVHTNPELRLGVFTSLLGTPFFFWLVVRIRRRAP